jgi:hypothetical protein
MVKVDFEFTTPHGVFRDALYLNDDKLSESELNDLKQKRLDNWLAAIENPPAPEPETVEIDGMLYEKVDVDGQIVLKPMEA